MRGTTDGLLRPILTFVCGNGATLMAWIDTAFQGTIIVPQSESVRCGVRRTSGFETVTFADGYQAPLPVGRLQLTWYGSDLTINALMATSAPLAESGVPLALLGLELLQTSRLAVEFTPSGSVSLTSP